MAKKTARRAAKKSTVEIDFTGVESGGGGFKIKEGPYLMAVEGVEDTESDAGNQMFKWTFVGKEGAARGKKFYQYTVYDPPDSLWKLRGLLEALGVEVPDGPMDLDLEEMVDLELIGIVSDEEYQNKVSSKMTDFEPVGGEEEEEEDEKPKAKRGKNGKPAEEEEEEEEDEKPKKGAKKKKTKELEAVSAEEVKAMDEDELEELVGKYELDVDLTKLKTARRKATAVIAALEEKELLTED
jgi:hypothetical protein